MSYDLWFWKEAADCSLGPADIANELACGKKVPGLEMLDLEKVTGRIVEVFPLIEIHRNPETGELRQLILDPADTDWVVLVAGDDFHFCVESHTAPGDILNQFIDLALEFECPLHDPQSGKRYE